ncbi:MAG TPA: preprotein translocase subunit SecE [Gemmatimonadales bacterium]|nr:preprotein translocase subunit SecE [Gemmatimonadales bacterium]
MNAAGIAGVVALIAVMAALVVWRVQVKEAARQTAAFMSDVNAEVRKVTWPDRQQLKNATGVIILFVVVVAILIGLMDVILQLILTNWLPSWFR